MNVLTTPASGSILFDSGTAGGSTSTNLTDAAEISYDGTGGIDITSYVPGNTDRFNVRGESGTLFSVSDALTGTIFSVNDAAGLPIIEVNSDAITDTIAIGEFGTNALFVSAGYVGVGTNTPTSPLDVNGQASISDDLAVNTDTLFVDVSTDRVGIGTAYPSTALHVQGTTTHRVYTVATLPSAYPAGQRSFISDSAYGLATAIGAVVSGGGSNKIPVFSDGSSWRAG